MPTRAANILDDSEMFAQTSYEPRRRRLAKFTWERLKSACCQNCRFHEFSRLKFQWLNLAHASTCRRYCAMSSFLSHILHSNTYIDKFNLQSGKNVRHHRLSVSICCLMEC